MGKFQTYQKKSFENNLMVLIQGIPLSSGEGPGVGPIVLIFFFVNISNDNTLNINTPQFRPSIEIVGFDVTGSSASRPSGSLTYRGKIEAKGKGEISMYFAERKA
jgi:hypothetical protein